MTQAEKIEARMLYRRSGYRRAQIKILCDLYDVKRSEILKVLEGMPSQTDEIKKELRKGTSVNRIKKMFGVSESTIRRIERKIGSGKRCRPVTNAQTEELDATAAVRNISDGKNDIPGCRKKKKKSDG